MKKLIFLFGIIGFAGQLYADVPAWVAPRQNEQVLALNAFRFDLARVKYDSRWGAPYILDRSNAGIQDFQLSLREDRRFAYPLYQNVQLMGGVPAIGHYQNKGTRQARQTVGDEYNLRKRLAIIELPLAGLFAPLGLVYHVSDHLGLQVQADVEQQLRTLRESGRNISFYFMVSGGVLNRAQEPIGAQVGTYNMVYHPWVRSWSGAVYSNVNVPMGIFSPNGVQPLPGQDGARTNGPIAFGTLRPRNINTHPSDVRAAAGMPATSAMSPNNARLRIQDGRAISTFWSAAVSPDRQNVVIVFHILANTPQAEDLIAQVVGQSRSMRELMRSLDVVAAVLAQPDGDALRSAVQPFLVMGR